MTDIFVGSVAVGVVPDARGWNEKLRQQIVPASKAIGDEAGTEMSKSIVDKMGKGGEESAGAFDKEFRRRLKAALDTLPKAKIGADATEVDAKLTELRDRIKAIHDESVIDPGRAALEIDRIMLDLHRLREESKDIPLRFDTKGAMAQLAMIRGIEPKTGASTGLLGDVATAAGAGAGGQGGGAGGFLTSPLAAGGAGPLPAAATSPVAIGGIAAGIAVLGPLIAQVISGGIVAGLGTGLAGVGIMGAVMSGKLSGWFGNFAKQAKADMVSIGQPMIPVIGHILASMAKVMGVMTPIFKLANSIIARPLQIFVQTLLKAFAQPAVQQSIIAVAKAFAAIMKAITPDVVGGMASIAQSITRLADAVAKNPKAFADFINFLFQVGIALINVLAALTNFATWMEVHWGKLWDDASRDVKNFVNGIKPEMDVLAGIIQVSMDAINGHWATAWKDMQKTAKTSQKDQKKDSTGFWHDINLIAGGGLGTLAQVVTSGLIRVSGKFTNWRRDLGVIFRDIINMFNPFGWQMITGLANGLTTAWNRYIYPFFTKTIPQDLHNWFFDAIHWLEKTGEDIVHGLFSGMESAATSAGNWINQHVWHPIYQGAINFFKALSPARRMIPLGQAVVQGVIHGMIKEGGTFEHFIGKIFKAWPQAIITFMNKGLIKDASKLSKAALTVLGGALGMSANAVAGFFGGYGGKVAGLLGKAAGGVGTFFSHLFGGAPTRGVAQWAGTVALALRMLRLPAGLSRQVLYQMQTESGGNPNAINLWDINAKRGDPSRGLLQTTGGTFSAYHVPGTSLNIFDPLANIAAAINYAMHVYGPSLMRGGMGMGSGHGYDIGGWLPPGATLALNNTGKFERVLDPIESAAYGSGAPTYNAHFDSLTGAAIESHVRTAFMTMSLTSGNLQRQGRRSLCLLLRFRSRYRMLILMAVHGT